MHTTMSDGECTPVEMVDLAHQQGVYFMSITDHDSVAGIVPATARAKALGIEFFPGVEISCYDQKDTHILGYNIDITNVKLNDALNRLMEERKTRFGKMLHALQQDGIPVTQQAVLAHCKGSIIGRPHIAQAMVDLGYGTSCREIFQRYLHSGSKYYVSYQKLTVKQGLELIKNAGGLSVLAHPKLLRYDNLDTYQLLKRYKSIGLDGIEVYYPCHHDREIKAYTQMAKELNLLVTFGSDYHNAHERNKNRIGYPDYLRNIPETMAILRKHKKEANFA